MHSFLKAQRGFTLMEAMFTVGILGVLLGLAVPSFIEIVRSNRLVTQNNEFIGALNFARSEALKRSDSVSVCSSSNATTCLGTTNWTRGWIAFTDLNGDGALNVGTDVLLQTWPATPREYTLNSTNRSYVRYGATGMSSGAEIFNLIRTGCVGLHARRIDVSLVGRVSTTTVACP